MSSIRTFRAANVRTALAMVRDELGADALILNQREIRRRRFPWSRTRVEFELTAGLGLDAPRTAPAPETGNAGGRRSSPASAVKQGGARPTPALETSATPQPAAVSTHSLGDPFHLYTRLIEQDVDEADAREVISRLQSRRAANADGQVEDIIAELAPCSGRLRVIPGRTRTVALVGPTGVGKTTTVAKLAANLRLRDRVRVGLITVDTYRVAAVDQLKTYAELIDVPMRVVTTPREMPPALEALSSSDLVLIDTAGRSPQDEPRIQELRSYLQAARADEVHLVLSLTAGRRSLASAAERFRQVGPTAALLTKLDEAPAAGAILSAARIANLPLSYLTTGQDVPEDIEVASPERAASLILGRTESRLPPAPV